MQDEAYYHNFDMERICVDKVFFVVYDAKYATEDHPFDKELRDRFIEHIKVSRIKKGNKSQQQVLRKENNYSSWELQLQGPRTMRFHVNIIHYQQELYSIVPDNVLHDDNFLPIDSKLKLPDHINALRQFIESAKQLYKNVVRSYWGEELTDVQFKISEIEVPFEIYPASVDDITEALYVNGVAFRKYNSQSGTLYLNHVKSDNEIHVNRKYDKIQKIDDIDIEPEPHTDIMYINKINSGRNEHKVQLKIYQKTFGLVRIETTMFSLDAKPMFNFLHNDNDIAETLINYIHHVLRENGINPPRYDRSLDDIVRFLALSFRESEDLIYSLKDADIFETSRANRLVQQRLTRKGILYKKKDNNDVAKRGIYVVNPVIRDFLRMYKEKGHEHFIKGGLFPDL